MTFPVKSFKLPFCLFLTDVTVSNNLVFKKILVLMVCTSTTIDSFLAPVLGEVRPVTFMFVAAATCLAYDQIGARKAGNGCRCCAVKSKSINCLNDRRKLLHLKTQCAQYAGLIDFIPKNYKKSRLITVSVLDMKSGQI